MDLRHFALILDAGRQAANNIEDAGLACALAWMSERAANLHLHPEDVDPEFQVLVERLGL